MTSLTQSHNSNYLMYIVEWPKCRTSKLASMREVIAYSILKRFHYFLQTKLFRVGIGSSSIV